MSMKKDSIAFMGVLILALLVRVPMLGAIHEVVFDEVHFGKFVSAYCCTHERFFDIHPPIGKLIIAGGAYLASYDGLFSFDHIGQQFGNVPIASIRLVPALFGSLLAGIIFILLRQLGVSRLFAILGGVAIALDNALIVESRLILTDNILLVFTLGAISAGIASVQAKSVKTSWVWIIITGLLCGAAAGTKFTGLLAGGLVGILFLWEAFRGSPLLTKERAGVRWAQWLLKLLVTILIALMVYLFAWFIHFSILTLPGSGDVWGVPTGNFFPDVISLQDQMISANVHLTAGHPYGSKWYTWPFMVRPVFYWQGENGSSFMYLLGNPAVWWGAFLLLIISALTQITLFIKHRKSLFTGFVLLMVLGYVASYGPLMRVPRVLFLYHYLTPLIFSICIGIWMLDTSVKNRKKFFWIALSCILVGFIYISPLT
ncbi:MAG: phospholipid carrier-dependent glycosyltransferase, partial [Candidatus Andersenbacteria bacterium]